MPSRKVVWMLPGALLVAAALAGCGETESACTVKGCVHDCELSLAHSYEQACVWTVGEQQLSLAEAIQACHGYQDQAILAGCEGEYQDYLDCHATLVPDQCGTCNSLVDAWFNCGSAAG